MKPRKIRQPHSSGLADARGSAAVALSAAQVPKTIMHFMVLYTKRGLQQHLIKALYRCGRAARRGGGGLTARHKPVNPVMWCTRQHGRRLQQTQPTCHPHVTLKCPATRTHRSESATRCAVPTSPPPK